MSGADRLRTGRPAVPYSDRTLQLVTAAQDPGRGRGSPPKKPLDQAAVTAPAVTQPQWERLLALVAVGTVVAQAVESLGVDPIALEGMLRADPMKYRAWREAQIAAERRAWSVEVIEGIIDKVANKSKLTDACAAHGKEAVAFMRLIRRDPTIKSMYEEARELAAELEADELRAIADDNSEDWTIDGKGNMSAVSRSDLRIKTRLRLMGAHHKKFADQRGGTAGDVKVQVNINHAERLEQARARVRKAQNLVKDDPQVIEAEVVEAENIQSDAEDFSWAS